MSKLDEKLQDILSEAYYDGVSEHHAPTGVGTEYLAQIKQAFADEGYWKPVAKGTVGGKQSKNGDNGVLLMTGQEWYDRMEAREAAKKAAGL